MYILAPLALSLCLAAPAAQATVVDFDAYPAPADFLQSFDFGGLNFAYSGVAGSNDGDMAVWTPNSPNSNGTNNLIFADNGTASTLTISRVGGGLFDLLSIDFAISWYSSTLTNSLFANGNEIFIDTTLATYLLNLTNVTAVTLTGLTDDSFVQDSLLNGMWLADNIVYDVAAVPVPAALPMLLLALGGLGVVARRRGKVA